MKNFLTFTLYSLLYSISFALCVGCSSNDNNKDNDEPDFYSWSDIIGFYATKPENVEMGDYDWATYYQAYALKIEENVLTDCGAIDNSDYIDGYIDEYCTELIGDWYSDLFQWEIYGLGINGSSVDIYDSGVLTGHSIDVYDNYIVYKGRTYYTASYFNENVTSWTSDNGGGSTPSQEENITVSISSRLTESGRFKREYEKSNLLEKTLKTSRNKI